jgi:hypothetical protein
MDLRGQPEILRVGADGNPVRYQWGAYDGMQNKWAIYRQFGWYRRSVSFCPYMETKAFFIALFLPDNPEFERRFNYV